NPGGDNKALPVSFEPPERRAIARAAPGISLRARRLSIRLCLLFLLPRYGDNRRAPMRQRSVCPWLRAPDFCALHPTAAARNEIPARSCPAKLLIPAGCLENRE